MSKRKKRKQRHFEQKHEEIFDETCYGFSFIAGYTSWGFPYGVFEEIEKNEETRFESDQNESDEDLPF